jgi:hypothetical protein
MITPFIESFATQHLIPPWVSDGVRTWVFALPLTAEKITWLLDKFMNGTGLDIQDKLAPSAYVYTPRRLPQQYAFLVIADHREGAISHSPSAPPFGKFKSVVVGLTVPAMRAPWPPTSDIAAERVWVQPFTACDSSTWVFSAREIWGVDAQKMKIDLQRPTPGVQLHLDASYIGIAHFDFKSVNEMLAALHVEVGEVAPGGEVNPAAIDTHLQDLVDELSGQGDHRSIQIDSLKEFRSTADLDLAIYRALVSSRQTLSNVSPIRVHRPSDVAIDFMWTDGMEELLQFLELPTVPGPPPPHKAIRPPPPPQPGDAPTETRWALNRGPATVMHCVSFAATLGFSVLDTLHVYQPFPVVYRP